MDPRQAKLLSATNQLKHHLEQVIDPQRHVGHQETDCHGDSGRSGFSDGASSSDESMTTVGSVHTVTNELETGSEVTGESGSTVTEGSGGSRTHQAYWLKSLLALSQLSDKLFRYISSTD